MRRYTAVYPKFCSLISMFFRAGLLSLGSVAVVACGGGADGSGGIPGLPATPVKPPAPNTDTVNLSGLYLRAPDVAKCDAGELKPSERQKVLARINMIRALHGLPNVVYETNDNVYVTAAALIIAANEKLSHSPDTSSRCYSNDGYIGSKKSNLHMGMGRGTHYPDSSESVVDGFLIDEGVNSIGHRRWLLDPFLYSIAFSRVDGIWPGSSWGYVTGATLRVVNDVDANISHMSPTFIAYPVGNYPANLFDVNGYLSFSVLADVSNKHNNAKVSFSDTTIRVSNAGQPMTVHSQSSNSDGFGLPNSLQWKVTGLQRGISYDVSVNNVKLPNGSVQNYSYSFKLQ